MMLIKGSLSQMIVLELRYMRVQSARINHSRGLMVRRDQVRESIPNIVCVLAFTSKIPEVAIRKSSSLISRDVLLNLWRMSKLNFVLKAINRQLYTVKSFVFLIKPMCNLTVFLFIYIQLILSRDR